MMISVTPLYAVLLTLIFLALSARVIIVRRTQKIAYGSGENKDNIALIRAHANWVEYAPIGLLLMLIGELQGAGAGWLHLCGVALLAGRALHAYGMGFNRAFFLGRVAGTVLTLNALLVLVVINLVLLF